MHTPSMSCTRLLTATAIAFLVTLCVSSPSAAQAPRRAPFPRINATEPSDGALREYIASLQFISDHISSDERMLDASHTNLIVRIDPVVGGHLLNDAQLRSGRIVARLVNRGADSVGRFALAPRGRTYLWVQYVGPTLRGVLVSTDSLGNVLRRTPVSAVLETTEHAEGKQSLARWRSDSTARVMAACTSCPRTGWCKGDTTGTAVW